MNKQETARIIAFIRATLPLQMAKLSSQQQTEMVNAWTILLDDVPYEHATQAVKACLQRDSWLPSVADIREHVGLIRYITGPAETPQHRKLLEAGIGPAPDITDSERAELRDEYKRAMENLFGTAAADGSGDEH
jgi:hypothetical protein